MSLRERFGWTPRDQRPREEEVIDTSRRTLVFQGVGVVATAATLPVLERAMEINRLFGYSPAEIFGVDVHELKHPLLHTTSPHTPESLERTHVFVVGDSMARGYDRDDIQPKSTGEYLRDIMNHPNGLRENWECTVLAENGRTVDDLVMQLEEVDHLARGEKNIDIVLSAGGNDFREYVQTKQQEAKEAYESVPEMISSGLDRDIMQEVAKITSQYPRRILPQLTVLRQQLARRGTSLNRVAFINIPDLSKSRFDIIAEEVDLHISYDTQTADQEQNNDWVIKRLGRRLPYLANTWIGHHIWEARGDIGDPLWLNAYGLPSERLSGIHATAEGQFDLSLEYLAKTFMPVDQNGQPADQSNRQTLLAASKIT
jgi:hypothetical protein